jgi:pimeloyl-ACP methyl ester carboxylesterase
MVLSEAHGLRLFSVVQGGIGLTSALPVSAAQAAAVSSLRDLPLVVLSGEHHAAPYTQWQRDLAQLSSRGRHVVAIDRGHWIHLDHPEVVTRAIREVVAAACSLRCPSSNL